MAKLILNQYRRGSTYKDVPGELYHFPVRYLRAFADLPAPFIYYEPREGGDQVYFGTGLITNIDYDTEDVGSAYASIANYRELPRVINFYDGPNGETWEPAKTMRNSVRRVEDTLFSRILYDSGIHLPTIAATPAEQSYIATLQKQLAQCPGPGKRTPPVLRRIRRIIESYERPSSITNLVKETRGAICQLCKTQGFIKRDGQPYCEVHHLFHLGADPPQECLTPEYVVVLCATCHRRMHYAKTGQPRRTDKGWIVEIDGTEYLFETSDKLNVLST